MAKQTKGTLMILIKSEFLAWLKAAGGDNVVGIRGEIGACPIARYLCDKTNRGYEVTQDEYQPYWGEGYPIPTPEWAYLFINKIDNQTLAPPSVTAEEAIYTLTQSEGL